VRFADSRGLLLFFNQREDRVVGCRVAHKFAGVDDVADPREE
jgi:hypothetical protein